MQVLFATPEAHPLVKTGGLGDVSGALPAALCALGVDARLLLPGYPAVLEGARLRAVARDIPLLPDLAPVRLLRGRMPGSGTPLYVLDAPALYRREGGPFQGPDGADWPDNALRFGALSRMAALLADGGSPLSWRPQVLHVNDWQSGLAPAYLRYAPGPSARTVMSVHNVGFAGAFPAATLPALGLPWESFSMHGLEFHGQVSFLKAGLYYADHITTVSPTYAREIQTPEYGGGLHGLLQDRREALTGILNGIDAQQWNPATDAHLARNYGAENLRGKAACKRALQRRLGLAAQPEVPLAGVVSRLTWQKGSDLLAPLLELLEGTPLQLAVLGSGERAIEAQLRRLAAARPGRISVTLAFDEALAHQIEAGADVFLMPSRFEPCGLNQMYSMRYGTPPVVRHTGGLADSVVDATPAALRAGTATGFAFEAAQAADFAACVRRALVLLRDRSRWRRLQRSGMRRDFSWSASAGAYLELYERLAA